MLVSISKNCSDVYNIKRITTDNAFERIRTGSKYHHVFDKIRSIKGQDRASIDARSLLKAQNLPSYIWAVLFKPSSKRSTENIESYTGLITIDFDHLPYGFMGMNPIISCKNYIYSSFISPSEDGLKCVLKIPVVNSVEEYKSYFYGICTEFNISVDSKIYFPDLSCCDPTRLLFESFDPNIYINNESLIWEKTASIDAAKAIVQEPKSKSNKLSTVSTLAYNIPSQQYQPSTPIDIAKRVFKTLEDNIVNAGIGNRHYSVLKMARLAGGYIASNLINENEVLTFLKEKVKEIFDTKRHESEFRAVEYGIEKGKASPITVVQINKYQSKYVQEPYKANADLVARAAIKLLDEAYMNSKGHPLIILTDTIDLIKSYEDIGATCYYYDHTFQYFFNMILEELPSELDIVLDFIDKQMESKVVSRITTNNWVGYINRVTGDETLEECLNDYIYFPLDGIIELNDDRVEQTISYIKEQIKSVFNCPYKGLAKHLKWKKSKIYGFSGPPNHGKSELVMQLLVLNAIYADEKFGVFSPEESWQMFYLRIAMIYLGDSLKNINNISDASLKEALDWVKEHFFCIAPPNNQTQDEMHKLADRLVQERGIDGLVIDPWNQLDNESSSDAYGLGLSNKLRIAKKYAIKRNLYYIIIMHPHSDYYKQIRKDQDLPYVYPHNLEGGAQWNNKLDCFVSVLRPDFYKDPLSTAVNVNVTKVKEQSIMGYPGITLFDYSTSTGRFNELMSPYPLDRITEPVTNIEPFKGHYYNEIDFEMDMPF